MNIPFNRPSRAGKELHYIQEALESRHLSGGGHFTLKCQNWIEKELGCKKVILTPSCTAALEMAAMLLGIEPGDEVIMPSYTFSSTATAFVLRGALPVFIDIRPDTLNMDEQKIKSAITSKTKAIIAVHYSGVACEMDTIMKLARDHNLYVVEDAAQCLLSYYKGKPLGSFGHLSALSFHATKNITSGEGGALCINDETFLERAEIIRDKGTDRTRFLSGEVDKYSWHDIGSSYLMNEITAAFLFAQLEEASNITSQRLLMWETYQSSIAPLAMQQCLSLASIPAECQHNAHLFYLILPSSKIRAEVMQYCKDRGIKTATHYVPLHDSVAGTKYGRTVDSLEVTTWVNQGLLRLPLWQDLETYQASIIETVIDAIKTANHNKSRPVMSNQNDGNDSYDPRNFELLKNAADHFWFKGRNKLIIHAINKYYPNAKTMLEIGCGAGTVLSAIQKTFLELETVGTDLYPASLPIAKEALSKKTKIFQMDARNIPFRDHFDLIGTFDVLEHILEDELVIHELYKALKKKGILLITVPQHPWLWSEADDAAFHKRRYSRNELELKLKKAGFSILKSTSFMCILLPVLLISRMLQKGRYSFKKELEINPVLNRIFKGLLSIELALIKIGIRLPIGSTRFIVASKT